MKQIGIRAMAVLLALVLCLSMGGMAFAARVTYNTGNASGGYKNVIMNWGSRGTVATFLSPNAEDFYEDNGVSYGYLSQLEGSASRGSVPGSELYKALQNLMKRNHTTITSYADTKDLYRFTDCQNGSNSSISSFYSGVAIGPKWGQGSWNREHTWPNSKGLGGSDENDIMMLRPTATSENSSRGNTAYGESSGYYDPNDESGGKYDLHGDVARIMLYTYVRWGNTSYMWGRSGVMESVEVLLKWIEEDPVDTWELGRNDSVESITGTRNVFVDYPELAFILFGQEIPEDMTTPSGQAANGGTVVTPGATYTVSFRVPSGVSAVQSMTCGVDGITLPSAGTPDSQYTFVGWVASTVADTQTLPKTYRVGQIFTCEGNTTLYALYSYGQGGSGSSAWTLVTEASQLSAGAQLVLACNDKSLVAGELSGAYLSQVDATFSADNSTITYLPDSALIFTLGGQSGAWTLSSDGQLLGATAVKKLAWGSGTTAWSVSVSGGDVTLQAGSYGRFLYNVRAPRFTTYTSDTNENMLLPQLYMRSGDGGATYYTTLATQACRHTSTELRGAVKATCQPGYTGDTYCSDCGQKLSSGTAIAANGSHTGGKATCVSGAVCIVCGKSYGEKDPANHSGGTELREGDAHCLGCGALLESGAEIPGGDEPSGGDDEPAGEHTHSFGQFQGDEIGHWRECACGEKDAQGPHSFGDLIVNAGDGGARQACVECGFTQAVPYEPEEPPKAEPVEEGLPGWVIPVVIVAVVLIAGGVTVLVIFKKRKKD